MKRKYKPLFIGGLIVGAYLLWKKAKAESDPYQVLFAAAAKAPTVVKPGRVYDVWMNDGTTQELTSAELQREIDTKKGVLSYVEKEQL